MSGRILCVDDEPRVLDGLRLHLEMDYEVESATSGKDALALIEGSESPFDVVVSDMRMPGMDGAEFLSRVRVDAPHTMRVLLTGHSDTESALRAVNEGGIFRFLQKPCPPETLLACIEDALEVVRRRRVEEELLSTTLKGSVEVLTEVLAVACPVVANQARLVQTLVARLGPALGVPHGVQWQLEVAALLCRLGSIAVPVEVVERHAVGQTLSDVEEEMMAGVPKVGAGMIGRVPRLEDAAALVEMSRATLPDGSEPLQQRILNIAMWASAQLGKGTAWSDIVSTVRQRVDRTTAGALGGQPGTGARQICSVRGRDLLVGMSVLEDVFTSGGQLVVRADTEISQALVSRLHNFASNIGLKEPIRVALPN